jgi:DNA replication protein DnaC
MQELVRSNILNNIPTRKLQERLKSIEESNDSLQDKNTKSLMINRYAESNIPVEYWSFKMEKDFVGDSRLLKKYEEYTKDLRETYINGNSVCFAGTHGVGKTSVATSILKKASLKGYNCLYTTLTDIVNALTQSGNADEKFLARRELCLVDFLVIDEFDNRFMSNDNAAELYARSLESIFRTRSQNKLPTIMCTNSPNVIESFKGPLKASLDSLIKGYLNIFPVLGDDFRKSKEK